MAYDYSMLRGKIVEKYGSQKDFAKAIGLSPHTMSNRLNGKKPFTQPEICKIGEMLGIETEDLWRYFFTAKVQNVEL